jgi:hypothetical protein
MPSPLQGFAVLDTCEVGAVAGRFISAAIWLRAPCLLSTWNAWLTSNKNSDNNSAAQIESRVEFLFIVHLLMVAYGDHFQVMRYSN